MAGGEVPGSDGAVSHEHLEPGQKCEQCGRKIPYPKKETSPDTKTISYRLPTDEAEAHEELWEQAAEYVGVKGQKFEKFKILALALATVLQDPALKGFGKQ